MSEMQQIMVKVVEDYEGFPAWLNSIVRKEMLRIWNLASDESERLYSLWNAEFDSLYGKYKGETEEYDNFISQKWKDWYQQHIRSMIFDIPKTEFIEAAQPVFKLKGFPKSKASFHLIVVD